MGLVIGRKYRHYKGAVYIVRGAAKHHETKEDYVIYSDMNNSQFWIRAASDFFAPAPQGPENVTGQLIKFMEDRK